MDQRCCLSERIGVRDCSEDCDFEGCDCRECVVEDCDECSGIVVVECWIWGWSIETKGFCNPFCDIVANAIELDKDVGFDN